MNIFPTLANGCHGKKQFQKMECPPQQAFFFKKFLANEYPLQQNVGFF
jgi:hypothetical protein